MKTGLFPPDKVDVKRNTLVRSFIQYMFPLPLLRVVGSQFPPSEAKVSYKISPTINKTIPLQVKINFWRIQEWQRRQIERILPKCSSPIKFLQCTEP